MRTEKILKMSVQRSSGRSLRGKRARIEQDVQEARAEADEEEDDMEAISESYMQARQATSDIVGRRVTAETRAGYTRTLNFICRFFKEKGIANAIQADGNTLKLPMKQQHLEIFLSEMTRPFPNQSVRTLSTITGYISSIKFFCGEENVELSKDCYNWIAKFIEGYKRVIADLKDKGIMKNYEGKVPITLATYSKLCGIALFAAEQRARSASSVHSFMILCWNLFARSNSVAGLRTHHLCWIGDALVVDMSKQKADQTGEKITPKHLYANPFRPEMCPILALALQIFSTSFRPDNENKSLIFLGNSYDVFQNWLQVAVSALNELGLKVEDFGTHSFRKGIATYAAGFIGGPSIIAIFLRAGWSLGQVHDRYLTYADGGDQFCGRVACGLKAPLDQLVSV